MQRAGLIVFPGGFNWPVWVAQEVGFFARRGVAVDLATTPGSAFQWSALADGRAQLAVTLMDNVIAYREGQGAVPLSMPDAIAVMGLDTRSMPALIAVPAIRAAAQLRGATLAVDAVETGNALVLQAMLERHGLPPGAYALEPAGGVAQRFEAVQRGDYPASLFNAPLDALLVQQGFNVLDRADAVLDHFQGHVLAVRRAWADVHRDAVVGVVAALRDALAWLYDPAHRADAFALYRRRLPDAAAGAEAAAYGVLFDPDAGFPADGAIDVDGVAAVLRLRARYGRPAKPLQSPEAYYDLAFLTAAAGEARPR